MDLGKGFSIDYDKASGKVNMSYEIKAVVIAFLEGLKAKADADGANSTVKLAADTLIPFIEAQM